MRITSPCAPYPPSVWTALFLGDAAAAVSAFVFVYGYLPRLRGSIKGCELN